MSTCLQLILLAICLTKTESMTPIEDLMNTYHRTPAEVSDYTDKMAKLNQLQMKLLGVEESPEIDPLAPKHDGSIDVGNTVEEMMHSEMHIQNPERQPHLFEGDIVLTNKQLGQIIKNTEDQLWAQSGGLPRRRRNLESNLYTRWDISRPIPYYINMRTGVNEQAVLNGIARWERDSCVRFQRVYNYPNYNSLVFMSGVGCSSLIGKIGYGPQEVSLATNCDKLGIVTHEIGHALGFYHEQSRYDRDQFVQVISRHVDRDKSWNFVKTSRSAMEDYGVGYDYGSVMHYEPTAFSIVPYNINYPTIRPIDTNYQTTIGQRIGPAFADVKRINLAYCNNTCATNLPCAQGGYTDPNNCSVCRCPSGFGGNLCERADDQSSPSCGVGDITATENIQTITMSGTSTCNYVITAPADRQVYFQMISMTGFTPEATVDQLCTQNYVEIKYAADPVRAGARYCRSKPSVSISQSNQLVIIYQGNRNTRFTLNYRYDPPTPPATEAPATETPTTTSTTTQSTTEQTSATPYVPTFTIPTVTVPQTTTTVSTTTGSTIPPKAGCTHWSVCSAECGGCGVRSRTCNGHLETDFCNLKQCSDGSCCRPFLAIAGGKCFSPYVPVAYDEMKAKFLPPKDFDELEGSGQEK